MSFKAGILNGEIDTSVCDIRITKKLQKMTNCFPQRHHCARYRKEKITICTAHFCTMLCDVKSSGMGLEKCNHTQIQTEPWMQQLTIQDFNIIFFSHVLRLSSVCLHHIVPKHWSKTRLYFEF